jgi:hypothetical protein
MARVALTLDARLDTIDAAIDALRRDDSTTIELLRAILTELRLWRADGTRVTRPERPPVPHEAIIAALVTSVAYTMFSSREVIDRAERLDRELRAALNAADLLNARKLGKFLQGIEGRVIGGVRLERLGVDNQGAVWIFRVG